MENIYIIATIKRLQDNLIPVGWKETEEDAKKVVEDNPCITFLGSPTFVVIEEVSQSVPPMIKSQLWYKFEDGKYIRFAGLRNTGVFGACVVNYEQGVY